MRKSNGKCDENSVIIASSDDSILIEVQRFDHLRVGDEVEVNFFDRPDEAAHEPLLVPKSLVVESHVGLSNTIHQRSLKSWLGC